MEHGTKGRVEGEQSFNLLASVVTGTCYVTFILDLLKPEFYAVKNYIIKS